MSRIRALRKREGLSQSELAEKLHVTQTAVSQWETGRHNPDMQQAIEMAAYFKVSTDYILGIANSPEPAENKKKPAANDGHKLSVEERVDQILDGMADNNSDTLMLDGKPASPEALDALRQAIKMGVEYARKINSEKK